MKPLKPMDGEEQPFFSSHMQACPLQGHWISFQLVDEFGDGQPYAGLAYEVIDSAGEVYTSSLDGQGFAKVENCFRGSVVLSFKRSYQGADDHYLALQQRESYPLPITDLQARAEQTLFFHKDGYRREHNPAQSRADVFIQVEVRDLVEHAAHLPPVVKRFYPPNPGLAKITGEPGKTPLKGVGLLPNKHHVLEVRPLRALRPILSRDNRFSALNLYQLALMATMSYNDFGQVPENRPVDSVSFPLSPSFGNLFGEALANAEEGWRVDKGQSKRYFPLYENVAYSKRFEILPFDPTLYEQNSPDLGEEQEHPGNRHFFNFGRGNTDTQAFISHHDEVILIAVRGTGSVSLWETLFDGWRDADALQVPFEGGGKAHRGFYEGYLAIKDFIQDYLDQFHAGQKVIICGHSLGGAIAFLLAEALRLNKEREYDILLYTYGAPRAGDAALVEGASALAHHRMVNNNDPVPSVPAPWMNVRRSVFFTGAIKVFSNPVLGLLAIVIGLVRVGGKPYQHHGELQHFMPASFEGRGLSSILWAPGCQSIEEAACTRMVDKNGDMPSRASFLRQIGQAGDHSMVGAYIPNAWATLRRWQQTEESGKTLITEREFSWIDNALLDMKQRLAEASRGRGYNPTSRYAEQIKEENEALRRALSTELAQLDTTRQRLATLRDRRLTLADVYGSAAGAETLQASLERWMSHSENTELVQIAMIPQQGGDSRFMVANANKQSDATNANPYS